jgi:uncharacterized protein
MRGPTILLAFILTLSLKGQTITTPIEDPFVEVTGEADTEVIPDQIFISITLKESSDGKVMTTMESLEKNLKDKISAKGISLENLTLNSTHESIEKVSKRTVEKLKENIYHLKTNDPEIAKAILIQLQSSSVKDARIVKIDHSRMDEFKKEIRLKAVRSAKDKADKMLGALGEVAGKLIFLIEKDEPNKQVQSEEELNLLKIKLLYRVVARFEVL